MAVVFGNLESNTRLKVMSVAYLINSDPNGYSVNSVPDYPAPVFGKNHVMYFDPDTSQFTFELEDRELNEKELAQEQTQRIADLEIALAEMMGV